MNGLLLLGGIAWMLAAVLIDPQGRTTGAACLFLVGGAMAVLGVAGA